MRRHFTSNVLLTLKSSGSSQRQPQTSSQADMFGPYHEFSSKAFSLCISGAKVTAH